MIDFFSISLPIRNGFHSVPESKSKLMKAKHPLALFLFLLLVTTFPRIIHCQESFDLKNSADAHGHFIDRRQGCNTDPLIAAMIAAVNQDTLRKTLQQFEDRGSRFMLNNDRREIATGLMNKFLSYGYMDVKLDSFYCILDGHIGYTDSTWQYNVVCNLRGNTTPDRIYLAGAHYDSYSFPDPYTLAPGVDDNGSGSAGVLEMARVMAALNYHPEATIQFTLFAAEELGLYGSEYDSRMAKLSGKDIRMMFNMDMIAYDPDNLGQMRVTEYPNAPWEAKSAAAAIEQYTDLTADVTTSGGGDSYEYWLQGFPVISYEEETYSPYMHTTADTLGNCNIPFLTKVTRGILAALAEQILFPTLHNLSIHSSKTGINLGWKPADTSSFRGVNVYRSETTGSQYQKINQNPVFDSVYHDFPAEPNKRYYYVLTTLNDSLQESSFSGELMGARMNFCDTLLVLANLAGSDSTPDSVAGFYRAILDTIPYLWYDLNANKKADIGLLSRFRYIFSMTNTINFEIQDDKVLNDFMDFTASGGNLLFAGKNPMQFWMNKNTYPAEISDTTLFHQLFRISSVDCKIQSLMNRANSVKTGYNTLNVDPLKQTLENYPGQINNVEVYTADTSSEVIYRFDSKYDSASALGRMKNRPVGIEYMGSDFKSILLSFPLYYMDTNDARKFLHYVMKEKFTHPLGVNPIQQDESAALYIFPNPVTDACRVTFFLEQPGYVKLTVMSVQGQVIKPLIDQNLEQGSHSLSFRMDTEPSGLYQLVMLTNKGFYTRKIVRLK
jgi:hypothetical protein